jgi:hypothetical protein
MPLFYLFLPREGIEPSRTNGPRDFKSLVSTRFHHLGRNRIFFDCYEAPSGFEPLHKGFADLSLSRLGTAP